MTSTRTIDAANLAGFNAKVIKPVIFARLNFATGVQRFHTEIGPKTVTHPTAGAEVYTGVGDFGGISSEVVESIDGAPKSLTVTISAVDASLLNTALTDDYHRRDGDLLIGLEDETGALLADPEWLFSGFMDKVDIALSEGQAVMTLTLESRATKLLRSPDWRFTDEDKQREVSGDLAAEYVYRMQDLEIEWAGGRVAPPGEFDDSDRPRLGGQQLR